MSAYLKTCHHCGKESWQQSGRCNWCNRMNKRTDNLGKILLGMVLIAVLAVIAWELRP